MRTRKRSKAIKYLEKLTSGPLTIGKLLRAIRRGNEMSQVLFAKKLKISRSNLCDIEKERRFISLECAAKFARILGESEEQFVRIALQELINRSNLKYKIDLKAA